MANIHHFNFNDVARLPLPGDNAAIATRRLDGGTTILYQGKTLTLEHTVMEGHRFAIKAVVSGEALLSWGLPFGVATRDLAAGTYICNHGMLEALRVRELDFAPPAEPNFMDNIEPYLLEEDRFELAQQVLRHEEPRTFMGYRRRGPRGVGTRNAIVLLGTTSRTSSYVRQLEERLKGVAAAYGNIDGIAAVAHTEGSNGERPNNLELLLRTLAGFIVHPNVGAVLIVDDGAGAVTNPMLRTFLKEHAYPLHDVPHRFLTLGSFEAGLEQGEATVKNWLEAVNATQRTQEPADQLKIALQCGGSDAFSGISGNPLASWVAREIIRYGGAANLAETDELIGAEPYLLQKVRDLTTAQAFLAMVERFKERAAWHGTTAEGNPSGGNKYRGLYNIVLKSIGAAMKRHPDVRLDYVIDYGERMLRPGYYFMDSPGNDLESIAGQVASGCNMIFFITGNGSITNFPFAPTIKVVTTTRRYELLQNEMDVNAGAYLDGTPMDVLGAEMLALTLEVASGKRSAGEKAGHAQVQIWRDWQQTDSSKLELLLHQPEPKGIPLGVKTEPANDRWSFTAIRSAHGHSTDQLGLILPTSLCAGQVARMTAERLNHKGLGREQGLSRFVALVHTEGCGVSGGSSEEIYTRTLLGYLTHPLVKHCLLLEHGCEKTHNDYMRHRLDQLGFDAGRVGWASIQLDGGIQRVMAKIEHWFEDALARAEAPAHDLVGLECLRLGLLSAGPVPANVARSLANLTRTIVAAGGTVVVPDAADLLTSVYLDGTLEGQQAEPSLAYGQRALAAGFHIMETPTQHWVETLTGLGATGVEIMLAHVSDHPMQSHPLVPLLQVMIKEVEQGRYAKDLDLILRGASDRWAALMLQRLVDVATHKYLPKLYAQGNTDFQFTRGLLGISM